LCGICGFSGFEDDQLIRDMVQLLHHRGPDDNGCYSDEAVSLGHARLSIIDLSERGKQPLSNEDGDIWITFNGEIYNFRELKKSLGKHTFSSSTDTEVIIHAYEEYGLDFVKKLHGMFAFSLYDQNRNILILARDPIGKKPLYYYKDNHTFIFASEIKAILHAFSNINIQKEVDKAGLCSYLKNQYTVGTVTMFKGIKKVLPGHLMILDLNNKSLSIQKYWDISEKNYSPDEKFFIKKLRQLLEEATERRMIADVPIGSFLSGGIDSSAIVALAKTHVDYDFHTFSMGFGDLFSELDYARIAAEHIGSVHHEIVIEPEDVIKEIQKIAWHYDEPLGDAAIIANYFLSKEARKYVKVALAGEGGDELFGGYSSYQAGLKVYPYYKAPKILRKVLKKIISLTPASGNPLYNYRRVYLEYLAQENFEMAHQYAWRITAMNDDELKWFGFGDCCSYQDDIIKPNFMSDPLNKMLALDCKNHLPEMYLMKADKGMMANSIEERLPILDRDIIEFAFTVPQNLKIRNGHEKYIWKMAVRDLLPDEIVKRKKQGFGVPYTDWISGELKEIAEQKITESKLINSQFGNTWKSDKLNKLLKDDNKRPNMLLWNLFVLELWGETYFPGI